MYYFMIGMISVLSMFINVKILIRDKRVSVPEFIYLGCVIILIGYLYQMLILVWRYNLTISFSVVILYLLPQFLLILLLSRKGYSLKKASILSSLSIFIWILLEIIVWLIWGELLISSFENATLTMIILYILNISLPSVIISILFVHLTKQLRQEINDSNNLQKILAFIVQIALVVGSLILMFYPVIYQTVDAASFVIIIIGLSLAIFVGSCLMIAFVFYVKNIEGNHRLQRKEEEQTNLFYYMDTIEKQYIEIRKFRHDYENILTSLQSFIVDQDFVGLEIYYFEKLKPAFDKLTINNFQLEHLNRINIKEVKSILAVKLLSAQMEGIELRFEAPKTVDHLSVNTVALVRMIGILLDNAIEELINLGMGRLLVGLIKGEGYTDFIVQNTCSGDIPQLEQLNQSGFSTKGTNRGLGLSNLVELVHENPTISLETKIEEEQFIQILTIEEI